MIFLPFFYFFDLHLAPPHFVFFGQADVGTVRRREESREGPRRRSEEPTRPEGRGGGGGRGSGRPRSTVEGGLLHAVCSRHRQLLAGMYSLGLHDTDAPLYQSNVLLCYPPLPLTFFFSAIAGLGDKKRLPI